MLNWRPWAHSAGCWLSLLHLISIFSGPQLLRAQRPLRPDVAFPTTFCLRLSGTQLPLPLPTTSTSVLTALYNSSTPTQSPTRSLKLNAVHRSLSSGASVYEYIIGFTLSHFISQFPLLTAIGMCHFLPVHHLGIAFLGPGRRSKYKKMNSSLIKMLTTNYWFTNHIFNIYMYKWDLGLKTHKVWFAIKVNQHEQDVIKGV